MNGVGVVSDEFVLLFCGGVVVGEEESGVDGVCVELDVEDEDGDEELGMFVDDVGVIVSDVVRDVVEEYVEWWFGEN